MNRHYAKVQKEKVMYDDALKGIGFTALCPSELNCSTPETKQCIDCQQVLKAHEDTLCNSCIYVATLNHIGFSPYKVRLDEWKTSHPVHFQYC